MSEPLAIYLNDHLMGATAGVELFRRAALHLEEVQGLVAEIEQDRQSLLGFLEAVGATPDQLKVALGWIGEKVSRLKLNGPLGPRPPLSDVIELEALTLGARGKLAGWRLLLALEDPRLPAAELTELIARAERQILLLDRLRVERGVAVLSGAPAS